jgi:anti-sigma regulatory factor (Ser/Thr protein kinase)
MMNPQTRAEIQMPIRHRPMPAASASALARVADALDAFCTAEGVPPGTAWRLHVAVDEIVANIVTHGAAGGPVPGIEATFARSADVL